MARSQSESVTATLERLKGSTTLQEVDLGLVGLAASMATGAAATYWAARAGEALINMKLRKDRERLAKAIELVGEHMPGSGSTSRHVSAARSGTIRRTDLRWIADRAEDYMERLRRMPSGDADEDVVDDFAKAVVLIKSAMR